MTRRAVGLGLLTLVASCRTAAPPPEAPRAPRAEPPPVADAPEPRTPGPEAERYPDGHLVEYRVTCSLRHECRVTFRDDEGALQSEVVVGDWSRALRVPRGSRLWIRAGTGGCESTGAKATIVVDGELMVEQAGSPDPAVPCQWITAEAEYELP